MTDDNQQLNLHPHTPLGSSRRGMTLIINKRKMQEKKRVYVVRFFYLICEYLVGRRQEKVKRLGLVPRYKSERKTDKYIRLWKKFNKRIACNIEDNQEVIATTDLLGNYFPQSD